MCDSDVERGARCRGFSDNTISPRSNTTSGAPRNPIGSIQATMSAISIARTIHAAMASVSVSFASWERSVEDQQQLLSGPSFKTIPSEPVNLAFVQK
jgi:hypothetical protein